MCRPPCDAGHHVIDVKGRFLTRLGKLTVFTPVLGATRHEFA